MNRLALTLLALLGLATSATHAEPTSPRRARATPPYVLRAPSAFMPPAGSVEVDASAARQALHGRALYGLGEVAAVGTSLTLPGLACDPCARELSFEFRSGTHHTVGLTTLGWAYRLQLHNPATADRQVQLSGIASLVRPTWAIHGGPTYLRTAHGHLLRPWAAVQWRAP